MLRFLSIAVLLPASLAWSADWPMYLHDLAHTSYAKEEIVINPGNAALLQPAWSFHADGPIGSGVTAVDGRLYFGDFAGNFWALNAQDGSVVWKQFLGRAPDPADSTCDPGIGVDSQPIVRGDLVYVAGGDAAVYALDKYTGEIKWRTALADTDNGGYLWSSVMLSRNSIYIGVASLADCPLVRGGIARIPLEDPQHPVYQYFVPQGGLGASVWSTPAIDERSGVVYVTTGNADTQDAASGSYGSAIVALDADSLAIQSSFFLPIPAEDVDADWGSSPLLYTTPDGTQWLAANSKTGSMWALRTPGLSVNDSGTWRLKIATDCISPEAGCGSLSTPAFDGRYLYFGAGQNDSHSSGNGNVYAVDPVTRGVLWQHSLEKTVVGPVTLVPGLVFAGSYKGLFALDASSGKELWNDGLQQPLYSQPVVSDGTLYATYASGDLIAYGVGDTTGGGLPSITAVPSQLTFIYTPGGSPLLKQQVTVASNGEQINFAITSDSSWLTSPNQGGATTSALDILPDISALAPGKSVGTLTFASPGSQNGKVQVTVTVVVNPPPPAIASNAVANAASGAATFAPGSLFAIYANNLASDAAMAQTDPLPLSLQGIRVQINGQRVPLMFVGPNQINGQIPYETPAGDAVVTIDSGGVATQPVHISIAAAAPGIFMSDGVHALAQNSDYSLNTSATPAAPGDSIIVYFTGQGPLDRPPMTGTSISSRVLYSATQTTAASIGGQAAEVQYSGMTPGFVGLGQLNIKVPDLPPGEHLMTVQIGGAQSNSAAVSVRSK